MPRRTAFLFVCCLALAATALAAPQAYEMAPQATPGVSTAMPGRAFGQPVAVRIELTITDQVGTAVPTKKTISMLAADGEQASVRSTNRTKDGRYSAQFSIDAKPMLVQAQDKIRMDLSLAYDLAEVPIALGDKVAAAVTVADKDAPQPWTTNLMEKIGVIVDNGKPLIISQSADPRTDRKVTVEIKATVVK